MNIKDQIKIGDIVKYKNRKHIIIEIDKFNGSEILSTPKEIRVYFIRYYDKHSHPSTRQVSMLKDEKIEQLIMCN